jgi:hypothetical protein
MAINFFQCNRILKICVFWLITRRWFLVWLILQPCTWRQHVPSETSLDFQRNTWRSIPEDTTLRKHACKNLKSNITIPCWSNLHRNLMSLLRKLQFPVSLRQLIIFLKSRLHNRSVSCYLAVFLSWRRICVCQNLKRKRKEGKGREGKVEERRRKNMG